MSTLPLPWWQVLGIGMAADATSQVAIKAVFDDHEIVPAL